MKEHSYITWISESGVNIALKKPATQIDTDFGGEAARAVDGNRSLHSSCSSAFSIIWTLQWINLKMKLECLVALCHALLHLQLIEEQFWMKKNNCGEIFFEHSGWDETFRNA